MSEPQLGGFRKPFTEEDKRALWDEVDRLIMQEGMRVTDAYAKAGEAGGRTADAVAQSIRQFRLKHPELEERYRSWPRLVSAKSGPKLGQKYNKKDKPPKTVNGDESLSQHALRVYRTAKVELDSLQEQIKEAKEVITKARQVCTVLGIQVEDEESHGS